MLTPAITPGELVLPSVIPPGELVLSYAIPPDELCCSSASLLSLLVSYAAPSSTISRSLGLFLP
jgi:hypothetical protein